MQAFTANLCVKRSFYLLLKLIITNMLIFLMIITYQIGADSKFNLRMYLISFNDSNFIAG